MDPPAVIEPPAVARLYDSIVENAPDAIAVTDLHGQLLSWNPGAQRLLGYVAAEIIGQPVRMLIPRDRVDEEADLVSRVIAGQSVAEFDSVRLLKDGSSIDVALSMSPIRDRSGAVIAIARIMRDITGRKRHEHELQRNNAVLAQMNQELDAFVYTASHDLRSPLTGIATVAQWILDDDAQLSEQSRERLTLIRARIARMQRLLDDIRYYALADRMYAPSGAPMSAAALVADVVATVHVPDGFSVTLDASLDSVEITRTPLQQIMLNLINNAIKHHDRRTGIIEVRVESRGSWLRFSVIDDGPGIPEAYRESVFAMFSTLKPRDQVEGSGMGLALVKKIVERMGGRCGIDAVAARGTLFWFDWPSAVFALRPQT